MMPKFACVKARISEEDRNELKRLWRQASKLCHPDLVADDLKEEANRMMVQLNQAKQRGDVKAIRSLVARLQQGFEPMMASDRLNDLERIRKRWRRCVSKSTPR